MMAHFLYSRSTWLGAQHIYGPTVIRCLATVVAKVVAKVAATAVAGAVLLALAGCSGGDMSDSMQLTAEETTATPPPVVEEGPIKFVWDAGNGQRTTLISTTTSTTSAPTETFIAARRSPSTGESRITPSGCLRSWIPRPRGIPRHHPAP